MSITIIGLGDATHGLELMLDRLDTEVPRALTEAVLHVERTAKEKASTGAHRPGEPTSASPGSGPNVVTGNLRRSITHVPAQRFGVGQWRAYAGVATTAPYGEFLERGTGKMPAYPFIEPAVTEAGERARELVIAAFRMALS